MYTSDLKDRLIQFAKDVRRFVRTFPKTIEHVDDGRQLVRSSGSVAANYLEADEAVSRNDFFYRIKICKKEAKESRLWLVLLDTSDSAQQSERDRLIQESYEFVRMFSAMLKKSQAR